MEQLSDAMDVMNGIVWGPIMIILLVGTGVYLTIRLRFVQLRHLKHALACVSGKYDNPEEKGDISHFQALCAALSATIGTGNIAGVATAIALGGPGAIFGCGLLPWWEWPPSSPVVRWHCVTGSFIRTAAHRAVLCTFSKKD